MQVKDAYKGLQARQEVAPHIMIKSILRGIQLGADHGHADQLLHFRTHMPGMLNMFLT